MELSFAFLANLADVLRDGRLIALGIDFDAVHCSQFPMVIPLTLVVKIKLDPSEISTPHNLAFEVTRPSGIREPIGSEKPFSIKANPLDASRPSYSAIIAKIGFNVETEGGYLFHILINGTEIKSLPLDVRHVDIEIQTTE